MSFVFVAMFLPLPSSPLPPMHPFTQVIVINEGRVEECGTHDELISKEGVYKRLVLRQLTAGENGTTNTSL